MIEPVDTSYFQSLFGKGRLFEGAVLINLDARPERLQRSLDELKRYGVDGCVTRLSAVEHENPRFGCASSHLEAVRLARRNGWRSILILEDDIKIMPDFAQHAPAALEDLAQRPWGLFQFGIMNPHPSKFVSPNLFCIMGGGGAHAYALHERAYEFLLEDYICAPDRGNWHLPGTYPIDEYLNNQLAARFDAVASVKLLISQYVGPSDILKQQADYQDMLEDAYANIRAPSRTVVNFADGSVAIQWLEPRHGELLQFLFGSDRCKESWPSHLDLRIHADPSGPTELWRKEVLVYAGNCERTLARRLLEEVARKFAGQVISGLLLRAAALTVGTRGVLLAADTGAGQATQDTCRQPESVRKRLDEMFLFIPNGISRVTGLGRPLADQDTWSSEIRQNTKLETLADEGPSLATGLVSAPRCSLQNTEAELALMLFPTHQAGHGPELHRLSAAQAGQHLMDALVNGHSLPAYGFREIARLARSVPAYELRYSNVRQFDLQLGSLLEKLATNGLG